MGKQIEIEFISEGFETILTSSGTMAVVESAANDICDRANQNGNCTGFHSGCRIGRAYGENRALGFVYTSDRESAIAESEHKALSGAVR